MRNEPGSRAKVLVTGANGFVGRALIDRMRNDPRFLVRAATRSARLDLGAAEHVAVGDISFDTMWTDAVRGIETVVHLAARVHVMRESAREPLAEFRRVNTAGTVALARASAASGVRRLIYLSSIKVNGEGTPPGRPFREDDPPLPVDPYAVSKYEAEAGLREVARETGMEVVIIRPPLIYGPGVKANFGGLVKLAYSRIPLPLGSIDNKRSFVGLENIVDFILTTATHPAAANHTFLVADGEDLSTTELMQRLGSALDRPAVLIPVPRAILELSLRVLGKSQIAQRLCGSLQVDISKARSQLAWTPPHSVDEGLRGVAAEFLSHRHAGRLN